MRSGLLRDLLAGGAPTPEAIDTFLQANRAPLVEGAAATFLYRGEAHAVRLRHFIYGLESAQPFTRVEGTDLWYHQLDLPDGSRVEYKLEVEKNGHTEWVRDPLNPLLAHDPFGANSVCHGPGYESPAWILPDPEARTGSLETMRLEGTPWGDTRELGVYLPARFRRNRRYPLVIVHDGADYLRYSGMKVVLDNLIHRLEVAPLIAVFSNPRERMREYVDDPRHATFLAARVLKEAEARYPLDRSPGARGLMGASLGGVAALSTAWRNPGVFGRLLLQSGSFAFTDIGELEHGRGLARVVPFVNRFRENPGRPSERVFVSCGIYERLIYENRSIVPRLQATGMEVRFVEARDGHNWENWRDRLRAGLSWLFPGPLWFVYE